MQERTPDRVYVLGHRELIEAIVRGAGMVGTLPSDILHQLQRGKLEAVENGVVVRLWLTEPKPKEETPESLHQLLGTLLSENERPKIGRIRSWSAEEFEAVSRWAQIEYAWLTPITGHEPRPKVARPAILDEREPEPAPHAAKKKRSGAPKKKRARAAASESEPTEAEEPATDG